MTQVLKVFTKVTTFRSYQKLLKIQPQNLDKTSARGTPIGGAVLLRGFTETRRSVLTSALRPATLEDCCVEHLCRCWLEVKRFTGR